MIDFILNNIVEQFIETYDISNDLMNTIIRHIDLDDIKKRIDYYNTNKVEHIPTGWEEEKCGHVLKHNSNGTLNFCNIHKYEHYLIEDEPEIAHQYKEKTSHDLEYEINYIMFKKYQQEIMDYISKSITTQINIYINEHFENHQLDIGIEKFGTYSRMSNLIKLNDIIKKYKTYCFKTKYIEMFDTHYYCTFYIMKKHRHLIAHLSA